MTIPVPVRQSIVTQEYLPDGQYPAILYRIVQLGTQVEKFKNQNRSVKKVLFSFVIPSVTKSHKAELVPYVVHKEYTESLFETAHLRRDLIKMVGHDFLTEETNTDYDLADQIATACLVTTRQRVINPTTTYVDIIDFAPIPDDMLSPDFTTDLSLFTLSPFNWNAFMALSERIRNRIMASKEYQALTNENIIALKRQAELDRQAARPEDEVLLPESDYSY